MKIVRLSKEITHIHFFGEKVVVKMKKTLLRLNEEMTIILCDVYDNQPCTMCDISNRFIDKTSIKSEEQEKVLDIIEDFILNNEIGKTLFEVTEDWQVNGEEHRISCSGRLGYNIPMTLNLELTNGCNLNCSHCYKNANINQCLFLSFSKIKLLFERLNIEKISVSLTGGECTIHPDFDKIVEYLTRKNSVDMVSNGINIRNISSGILKKFKTICISLYGINNEMYYKNTGMKNGLDMLLKSAKHMKEKGIKFNVAIVLDKEKIENLEKYVSLAVEMGAENFQIGIPAKSGRLTYINESNEIWNLDGEDLRKAYVKQRLLKRKYSTDIEVLEWERAGYEKQYSYEDPWNPSNFYLPRCMKCGAGTLHWMVNEKFEFRPCALLPETYKDAIFSFEEFCKYVLNDIRVDWETIMTKFKKECLLDGRNASDYCDCFINFLPENK